MHSDVGGGYRPGEEGETSIRSAQLSLILLRHMYDEALDMGVPFLPEKAWQKFNRDDFNTDPELKTLYNHYMSLAGWGGKSLGKMMNAHMAVYYAWRFAQIRRKHKGDQSLTGRIEGNEAQYRVERQKADREIAELTRKEKDAQRDVAQAERQRVLYISARTTAAPRLPSSNLIMTTLPPRNRRTAWPRTSCCARRRSVTLCQGKVMR